MFKLALYLFYLSNCEDSIRPQLLEGFYTKKHPQGKSWNKILRLLPLRYSSAESK
jgi:hypothetical protein